MKWRAGWSSYMDCEDVGLSMAATLESSAGLPVDSKSREEGPSGEELNQVVTFTVDAADCKQPLVSEAPSLLEPAQQNPRIECCREGEIPSARSVSVVKSRRTSNRAASLDFLEYVLPYDDMAQQLGCNHGDKASVWKNLRFWQRSKKSGAAASCWSATSAVQHSDFMVGGHYRSKATRARREVLGPLYTDGMGSLHGGSGARRGYQQHPRAVIDTQALSMWGKRDGHVCPYTRLNRCARIPSAPLYLP